MAKYIDVEELLQKLPNDLPYKASVKRVLIQAPAEEVVSKELLEQYKYERDVAVDQLHSYGVELGEKKELAEVRHGEWLMCLTDEPWRKGYHGRCSECGSIYTYNINKMPRRCDNSQSSQATDRHM